MESLDLCEIIQKYKDNGYVYSDTSYKVGLSMLHPITQRMVLIDNNGRTEELSYSSYIDNNRRNLII